MASHRTIPTGVQFQMDFGGTNPMPFDSITLKPIPDNTMCGVYQQTAVLGMQPNVAPKRAPHLHLFAGN